jgi:hypothetical protein
MTSNRRTRILLYVPLLEVGGMEAKVGRLALGLDRARFDPIVAWSDRWGPVGDRLEKAGVPTVDFPSIQQRAVPKRFDGFVNLGRTFSIRSVISGTLTTCSLPKRRPCQR